MRNELEIIETIHRYLAGELSAEERSVFESRLAGDRQLQEELRLQQDLIHGMQRAALKEKIGRARKRFWRRRLYKGGAVGLGLVVVAAVTVWALRSSGDKLASGQELPVADSIRLEKTLPAQSFRIDGSRDTVLETSGGILLSVPAGSFRQDDGAIVRGSVDMVVREALTPSAIMQAGLSTVSGNTVLETGGMFSVDASSGGKVLKLDSVNGIYAQVPADTVKPGMQLYTGKRQKDGIIDWTDPRPIEHDLMTVDISSLNFYPPGYLDSLGNWGYDRYNKKFTDSLYYSFAQFFGGGTEGALVRGFGVAPVGDSVVSTPRDSASLICGINPARIKTIWSKRFAHTLLATREFEMRMPWIHRVGDEAVLGLYVNNLDKPLYVADSLAWRFLGESHGGIGEKFHSFYLRHDGRVKVGSRQLENLAAYYEEKTRVFTEAITRTEREFWDRQAALDREADRRRQAHEADSEGRVLRNFGEELVFNLKSVCRQLGYDPVIVGHAPLKNCYEVKLTVLGWCNIDRPTWERVSFTVVEDRTGRKAHIEYLPMSIGISQYKTYDRVYVYLLPDSITSFMRVKGADGLFSEKLNGGMHYDLVCIGYRGEQAFYYYQKNITPGDHAPVELEGVSDKELNRRLNSVASKTQAADLQRENAYFRFEIGDQPRRAFVKKIIDLQCAVMRGFFPCFGGEKCAIAE